MVLPRECKLKDRRIFKNIHKFPFIGKSKYFKLMAQAGVNLSLSEPISPKVGIIISKKIHKSAVKRNLIRRRIEEAYRLNLPFLQDFVYKYKYFVFFPYLTCIEAPFQELRLEVKNKICSLRKRDYLAK